jgi:hypothetical protein
VSAADPVSWLMIEPGWAVVDSEGNDVGRVEEVAGDSSRDIFNGLAVSSGMLSHPRYVPAEQVVEISEGRVRIASAIDSLAEYREPPSAEEVSSEKAGLATRLETDLERPPAHARRVPLLRRVLLWFGLAGRR